MSNRWPGCVKFHEHCGGLVRWVEAVETPGVGYTGECIDCGEERLVVEEILPVEVPDGMRIAEFKRQLDGDEFDGAAWDDDADWDANQTRLRERVDVEVGRRV